MCIYIYIYLFHLWIIAILKENHGKTVKIRRYLGLSKVRNRQWKSQDGGAPMYGEYSLAGIPRILAAKGSEFVKVLKAITRFVFWFLVEALFQPNETRYVFCISCLFYIPCLHEFACPCKWPAPSFRPSSSSGGVARPDPARAHNGKHSYTIYRGEAKIECLLKQKAFYVKGPNKGHVSWKKHNGIGNAWISACTRAGVLPW